MSRQRQPSVVASSQEVDDEGVRAPAGEVHAWEPPTNQTLCGLALSRSGLLRFPHVKWADVQPESGGAADWVQRVCPRCAAAGNSAKTRGWQRIAARP